MIMLHLLRIDTPLPRSLWIVIVIEISSIRGMIYPRDNRTLDLPIVQRVPIDAGEELMLLDSLASSRDETKTFGGVDRAESGDE